MMIRVFIADDHQLFRDGLKRIFSVEDDISIAGEAANGFDALELLHEDNWDIAILDVTLPNPNGLEVLKRIITVNPKCKILMLSMYHDDEYAFRALRIGAFAYLNKNSSADLLITVIRRINSGRKYIDPRIAEELIFNQNPKSDLTLHCLLSDREYEILRLITEGVPLSKISSCLSLSAKTVTTYRTRILEKMSMKTNAQLIRYAIENKLWDGK